MVDAEEDDRWGEDFRGDENARRVARREKRLAAIQAAKARLEAAQRGSDDERGREPGQDRNPRAGRPYIAGLPASPSLIVAEQFHATPSQSQIMKTCSEGFQLATNAPMAVDSRRAPDHRRRLRLGPQASDQGQLVAGCSTRTTRRLGSSLRCVLADAGYCTSRILLELEDRDHRRARSRWGVKASPRWRSTRPVPATHRMGDQELGSPRGQSPVRAAQVALGGGCERVASRRCSACRRFSLRGLAKVRGEWDLVCLALNIADGDGGHVLRRSAGLPSHLLRAQCHIDRVSRISSVPAFRCRDFHPRVGRANTSTLGPKSDLPGGRAPIAQHQNFYGARS